ncbi:two-component fusion protein (N:response regulator receiver-C:ABC-type nitrate/sulfonate/bicarbonate transport system, periplasmic component) [Desulforapulum autotrophicum HRM2]|uniref:Two-component fusion protein (N:response regulator receiver-C:ABC-type nitrate/sulfonate/bicarbonate transport system, periplasmic component) n=1 Tax=Desulforapulum autotrophicum (strain ATCC 43914 / DSM 3382 / VKM B-1955 / HRM2) TaxID=177437 RepID=C0Q919_DESAH|nr:ABC transporter substrate-binding protein [Desulforapulum autotrophicum]ACN16524.1 two-component fusion protein (N:response regulator receiver-C:ABC-type nitrate/sulfonate/bicarbonate transport system, periplasmic component) [Desulforapulum autotrophicum HRM2]
MVVDPNIKILVVDDSGTMRVMFKQILKQAGFENIIMAVNGDDGIKKVKEENPDLVISDWNMPKKDGLEFLQWLRSQETYKKIPFIMATAQADKGQQIIIMEAGGNGHVPKPFDAEQIKTEILKAFSPETKKIAKTRNRKVINNKVELTVSHIQITDHLVLGALKHRIENGEVTPRYFDLKTDKKAGWNPIQEGLENGQIDCAFVLAPIAMDLFAYDTPIKMVLLAHKNGSTFVRSRHYDPRFDSLQSFYKYKVVDIPHKMSVHHMLAHQFLKELGLKPGVPGKEAINVRFEVVPPIKMPGIMEANEDVAGFMVAEPIATKAMVSKIGNLEFISSSRWKDHPCCIVAMQNDFIDKFPDAAQEFVSLLMETGKYIEYDKIRASNIGVRFLDPDGTIGLKPEVLQRVFSQPMAIKMDDLYPVVEDFDIIQKYMHDVMGIGRIIDLEQFIYAGFAGKP